MLVQNLPVGGAQPISALADSVGRQNTATTVSAFNNAEAQVGGLQSNAVAASSALEKQGAISPEDVDQAVQQINETLQAFSQKLEFSVDKDTEAFVVKVVDKETREVIRQIPSEEMLNLAKALDKLQGLLIEDKA